MPVTDRPTINAINRKLAEDYPTLDRRSVYRVVWSGDELEVRKGKFSEFYGHIFIRSYQAVKPIRKYWYLDTQCWVLEKLIFIPQTRVLKEICEELVEAGNGTYEPVFAFFKNDEHLEVNQHVIDRILYSLHNPTKRDLAEDERLSEEDEVKYFYEEMSKGERSPLFVFENSAFVSANQLEYRKSRQKEYIEPSSPVSLT